MARKKAVKKTVKKTVKKSQPAVEERIAPEYLGVLRNGSRDASVNHVQEKLGITGDGWYGRETTRAVRKYQQNNKLYNDGIVGPKTWKHMFG